MVNIRRVLVATDFSNVADAALDYGHSLAEYFHADLYVVHVAEELMPTHVGVEGYVADVSHLQRELEELALRQMSERLDRRKAAAVRAHRVVLRSSAAARTIVEFARNADIDLIVVGTHGRSRVSRLVIGSVAERVVRTAACPVLSVHHPDREFVLAELVSIAARA